MNTISAVVLSMIIFTSTPKALESLTLPVVELTVQEKIEIQAENYGVDASKMLRIADAESDFKNVCNWKYTDEEGKYTACGVLMITRTTWKTYCGDDNQYENRMNEDKNIECGMKIASKSGYHHWNESKHNWN